MDCIEMTNLTVTLPFILDLYTVCLQLEHFFRLPSKLSRGGHRRVKTTVEWEH